MDEEDACFAVDQGCGQTWEIDRFHRFQEMVETVSQKTINSTRQQSNADLNIGQLLLFVTQQHS